MWTAVLPLPYSPPNLVEASCSTTFSYRLIQYHFNKKFVKVNSKPAVHVRCSSASQGASSSSAGGEDFSQQNQESQENSAEMSSKLAKLGLSAVLAYGLFDGVTYTSFFVLAFLGYEKSTGKNPAANLQALLGIVILMWTGNNVTRPFRVAGAAALAPVIDKGLRRIQKYFNFPSLVYAFALVVSIVAASCLTIVSLLILSRWGKCTGI
ncbi:hypothetical protein RHSIM_Rhsim03G0219300 [Rhododendron simsii]|uniref:Uncharacterized protein n=2 Tax=Rhododendron TaxID=4346 RepID=A0A834H6B9_RHOSS|nr:hypothetical protein RHSIM_Rhsim03G0219300 [Rhododendron simsii]